MVLVGRVAGTAKSFRSSHGHVGETIKSPDCILHARDEDDHDALVVSGQKDVLAECNGEAVLLAVPLNADVFEEPACGFFADE